MTDRTDAVVHALFQKPSLAECSLQQVAELAQLYPYFSAAQRLLVQKTNAGSEAPAAALQRAALQASHPWQVLQWLTPQAFETNLPAAQLFQNPIADVVEGEPENIAPEAAAETTEKPAQQQAVLETTPPVLTEAETKPPTEKEAPPATPPITFEPYHTVDYFASQGIKLSQQEASNDALGKQLKSFTEWLKTMKRLPETTPPQPGNNTSERNIENLAAHSLDAADIVTESMAEVWLKQGNKEKAAEVYTKLTLRHPAKSAYFAAKIEALKTT